MAEIEVNPLSKQAESFYARAKELTAEMEKNKLEAAQLEELYPHPDDEQKLEIDWKLHKADANRRAAAKFVKRGDKLMRRWNKFHE